MRSLIATLLLAVPLTACQVALDADELSEESSSIAGISCGTGVLPYRHGVDYTFWWGTKQHAFKITRHWATGVIRYVDRVIGTTTQWTGRISGWSTCPHPNEALVLTRDDGAVKTCTHVCLPDGREELHCPNGQFLLSPPTYREQCVTQPVPLAQAGSERGLGWCGESGPSQCRSVWSGSMCQDSCDTCWRWWCDPAGLSHTGDREQDEQGMTECLARDPDGDGPYDHEWCTTCTEDDENCSIFGPGGGTGGGGGGGIVGGCTPPSGYANSSWCAAYAY